MKSIFIANSKSLICDALCTCCSSFGLKVIGKSTNGLETFNMLKHLNSDFYILDTDLPYIDGLEINRRIRAQPSNPKIILYVGSKYSNLVSEMVASQVDHLLFEQDELSKLKDYLLGEETGKPRDARLGINKVMDYEIKPVNDRLNSLTPTQLRILSLIGTHRTMPQIAKMLFISPHTVNNHVANIRKKLRLKGRGVILKYALEVKDRLVEIDSVVIVNGRHLHVNASSQDKHSFNF